MCPEPLIAMEIVLKFDIFMLAYKSVGKGRREAEINSLAKEAGFISAKVVSGYVNS